MAAQRESRRPQAGDTVVGGLLLFAVSAANGALTTDLDFATVNASGSSAAAVNLNNVAGNVDGTAGALSNSTAASAVVEINSNGALTLNLGAMITNALGNSVEASGNSGGSYTLSGDITDTAAGIDVTSNTGGIFTFSGASKSLTTGTNVAVNLTSNGAGTVNFTNGGLVISTTSGAGFNATGGGNVNVTGTGNTVSSGSGTAINIANTTIGASGVTFRTVSATSGSPGINLNNSGSTGPFLVSGDGSMTGGVFDRDGSGGTINSTIGTQLTNAHNVTLRQMNFVNNGDHAVQSTGGSGHILSAVTIQNPANHGWEAIDLAGTSGINHGSLVTQFNTTNQDGVRLINTNTSFTSFTVDGSTFSNSATGNDGFFHRALGTTAGSVIVTNNLFTGLDADGAQVANDGSGTIVTTVQGNDFLTADATGGDGNNGLAINLGGAGIHQFLVGGALAAEGNTFTTVNRLGDSSGVINVTAAGAGTGSTSRLNGTIRGNAISDSDGRRGISVLMEASGGTGHGGHTVVIDSNDINDVAREGIYVGMSSVAGRTNTGNRITITNNSVGTVSVVSTAGNREGIEIEAFHDGAGGGSIEADALVQNNVAVTNNTDETFRVTNDAFTLAGAATTTLDVTVLGNVFTNNDASGDSFEHRSWDAGSTSCLDINAASAAGNRNNGNRGYLVARSGGAFGIEGMVAGPHNNAAVNTFVDARNDGGASAASGDGFMGNVTCAVP